MGSRLGRRVIHFANLPLKLMLPPAPLYSVQEFAVRTVPSASKVDIRRCLESMYGFSVAEVRTLNMEGKKQRRGPFLNAKPDYKKAYVTLTAPLAVSRDLFPIGAILGERERKASAAAAKRKAVEGAEVEGKGKHWMEDESVPFSRAGCGKVVYGNPGRLGRKRKGGGKMKEETGEEGAKFPWSGMGPATEKPRRARHSPPKKKGIALKQKSRKVVPLQHRSKKLEA
ncbi:hypothetical protein BS78_01G331300 [Paspalum vaginatum]|nr:hypothetical protein BS78_01G331300 [Paspalum vaginatum]